MLGFDVRLVGLLDDNENRVGVAPLEVARVPWTDDLREPVVTHLESRLAAVEGLARQTDTALGALVEFLQRPPDGVDVLTVAPRRPEDRAIEVGRDEREFRDGHAERLPDAVARLNEDPLVLGQRPEDAILLPREGQVEDLLGKVDVALRALGVPRRVEVLDGAHESPPPASAFGT